MNVAAPLPLRSRRAVSPYARRLAREMGIALEGLAGTGPSGRIIAEDIRAYEVPVEANPVEKPSPSPAPALSTFTFSATVSLVEFNRLAGEVTRVGRTLEIEDIVHQATRAALTATDHAGEADAAGIALEADGRQILVSTGAGLSIGTESKLRHEALERGSDVSGDPAIMSLLVLRAARAIPASMPLLSGRWLRLVVVVDETKEVANALLCANAEATTELHAVELLEAFVVALERPLALMA